MSPHNARPDHYRRLQAQLRRSEVAPTFEAVAIEPSVHSGGVRSSASSVVVSERTLNTPSLSIARTLNAGIRCLNAGRLPGVFGHLSKHQTAFFDSVPCIGRIIFGGQDNVTSVAPDCVAESCAVSDHTGQGYLKSRTRPKAFREF